MVALVVVVLDEDGDRLLDSSGQVTVLDRDPVLQRLVPALDLALGLRMLGLARTMCSAPTQEPRSVPWQTGKTNAEGSA